MGGGMGYLGCDSGLTGIFLMSALLQSAVGHTQNQPQNQGTLMPEPSLVAPHSLSPSPMDVLNAGKVAPVALSELIDCFSQIMTAHGFAFHIASGTLLGQVRDTKILPWDYDVDMDVSIQHWEPMRNAFCGDQQWAAVQERFPVCARVKLYTGNYQKSPTAPEDCGHCYDFVPDVGACTSHEMRMLHSGPEQAQLADGVSKPFRMDINENDFQDPIVTCCGQPTSIESILPLQACSISGVNTSCPAVPTSLLTVEYGEQWATPPYTFDEVTQTWVKNPTFVKYNARHIINGRHVRWDAL